ncbi:MAG TPA: twin-arginine translocase TatA/TatE family subunit [Terracidiphilus sp.]|jgi:sec-independent protein translocase protein TatB|nr:twin-arginine translocase TatA/TatE family subunit [Terracidiphilus sp.]
MVNPPPIQLGTLGMSDSLILMVLALVVFGPRRLPQIGRQIGKLMYEFRKASNDFKFQMEEELRLSEDADRRKKQEAEQARNLALNPPAQTIESQAAIGAQESVSAPSHSLYGSGSGYPDEYPPETPAAAADEPTPTMPRIQPPSTGAPVRQGRGTREQEPGTEEQATEGTGTPAAEQTPAAEASIAAESAATIPEAQTTPPPEPGPQSNPNTTTETVIQNG